MHFGSVLLGFLLLKLPELCQLFVVFSTTTKLFLAGLDQKEGNSSIPQESNSNWKKLGGYV